MIWSEAPPDYAIEALREALPAFDRKLKGFAMEDAVLTGVETRTSSPIRIKRGPDYQSLNVRGLFPAGEGAGYAGGILSAGVDGIEVAEAVARELGEPLSQPDTLTSLCLLAADVDLHPRNATSNRRTNNLSSVGCRTTFRSIGFSGPLRK